MADDLSLPIDTAWLRKHAPRGTNFGSRGFCQIPFKPRSGWGIWSLTVWRLLRGKRRLDLKARPDGCTLPAGCSAVTEIGVVRTRAQLINVFNKFSREPWTP